MSFFFSFTTIPSFKIEDRVSRFGFTVSVGHMMYLRHVDGLNTNMSCRAWYFVVVCCTFNFYKMSKLYHYVEIYIKDEGSSVSVIVSGEDGYIEAVGDAFAQCPDEISVTLSKGVAGVGEITITSKNPDDYSSRILKAAVLFPLRSFDVVPTSIFVDSTKGTEQLMLCRVELAC